MKYTAIPFVKVGGQDLSPEMMADLLDVVVDTSLYVPSMFEIRLLDHDLKWVDDATFDIGNEVEVSVELAEESGGTRGVLIKGEITAIEPDFSAEGDSTLLIRGYDKSHRLHRGKKTRTFLNQKDSDFASKVAGEAGLSSAIDSTQTTYDYVLQNNQTNMEFLLSRAERIGYQVFAAEGKLYFKKGDANLGDGPELMFLDNLTNFRPALTMAHQADATSVRGWDPKGKAELVGTGAPGLKQGGETQTGGAAAKSAFGAAEEVVVDWPVTTKAEADELATGLGNDISRGSIQAEGVCAGHPGVKAGYQVTVKGVGTRFSGKYFVTSATHVYNAEGYQTSFRISGRQPDTLSHLLGAGNGHSWAQMQGVVPALVTNLNDPDDLGRVKVKYAWLGDIESDWVRIATPMSGPQMGLLLLPEVNDEVLIAFEHGDVHRPYLIGSLWNSKDKPPKANSAVVGSGKVNERLIKSRSGHLIILDDTSGSEKITIQDKTGNNEMVIDSANNSMSIKVNGDFTVDAKGKVTINSTQDMTLNSKANGNIKTTGNLAMKATGNLNAEATGNGTVKGLMLTLEGSTKSTLKGLTVGVEGSTMTEVKGALVKIN